MTCMAGLLVWACVAGATDAGLAGRWNFDSDDAAGLLVLDSSGNANHGQLRGARWVPQGD